MKCMVTGGGGFLGQAICRELRSCGMEVVSLARNRYPELDSLDVIQVQGDITCADHVQAAAKGCDAVIHTAARAGVWGPYPDYYRVNVTGTENVIRACHALNIRRLVHTSSPSVVFDGRDIQGADESLPYPQKYHAAYPRTKALAEQRVLKANSADLRTVALRPHLIWGPGDNHLVPRIISRGQAGQLRQIGNGKNLVDSVYIDNAAHAHILALECLQVRSPVCGKAYFITNGEPLRAWDLINSILDAAGLAPVTKSIPAGPAYLAGFLLEVFYRIFRISDEPRLTRFVARELSTSHWFDISAARNELGYQPEVSIREGLRRLQAHLSQKGQSVSARD